MKLQIASHFTYANLAVLRATLESCLGDQKIVFTHEYGSGRLTWRSDEKFIAVAIPQDWLDVRDKAQKLEMEARNFARWITEHSGKLRKDGSFKMPRQPAREI